MSIPSLQCVHGPNRIDLIRSYIRELTIYSNTRLRTSVELQVQGQHGNADTHSGLPAPTTAVSPVQTWNKPRTNVWKISATFIDFIVMGLNDAAYGVSVLIACGLSKLLLNHRPGLDPLCMSLTLRQRSPKAEERLHSLRGIMTSTTPLCHSSSFPPWSGTPLRLSSTTSSI